MSADYDCREAGHSQGLDPSAHFATLFDIAKKDDEAFGGGSWGDRRDGLRSNQVMVSNLLVEFLSQQLSIDKYIHLKDTRELVYVGSPIVM